MSPSDAPVAVFQICMHYSMAHGYRRRIVCLWNSLWNRACYSLIVDRSLLPTLVALESMYDDDDDVLRSRPIRLGRPIPGAWTLYLHGRGGEPNQIKVPRYSAGPVLRKLSTYRLTSGRNESGRLYRTRNLQHFSFETLVRCSVDPSLRAPQHVGILFQTPSFFLLLPP